MSAVVDHDPALRLWRAETRWLHQSAVRLRQAEARRRHQTRTSRRSDAPKGTTR